MESFLPDDQIDFENTFWTSNCFYISDSTPKKCLWMSSMRCLKLSGHQNAINVQFWRPSCVFDTPIDDQSTLRTTFWSSDYLYVSDLAPEQITRTFSMRFSRVSGPQSTTNVQFWKPDCVFDSPIDDQSTEQDTFWTSGNLYVSELTPGKLFWVFKPLHLEISGLQTATNVQVWRPGFVFDSPVDNQSSHLDTFWTSNQLYVSGLSPGKICSMNECHVLEGSDFQNARFELFWWSKHDRLNLSEGQRVGFPDGRVDVAISRIKHVQFLM